LKSKLCTGWITVIAAKWCIVVGWLRQAAGAERADSASVSLQSAASGAGGMAL